MADEAELPDRGGVAEEVPDVPMSGPELVARAKERLPHLKTLYSTGYTADMALRHRLLDHMDEVLPKPYTPEELYRKVRGVMGA